jgi:hypothetical protein
MKRFSIGSPCPCEILSIEGAFPVAGAKLLLSLLMVLKIIELLE